MNFKMEKFIKELWVPLIISIIVLLFHTSTYYMCKFTPFEPTLVGGALDQKIPFSPVWVVFYVLWHPLLIITPCLLYLNNRDDFYKYIVINFLIEVLVIFIFIFYPTIYNRPDLVVNDFFTWVLNIIYMSDTPATNCLPSMHCIICFTAIYIIVKSNKIGKKCKVFGSLIYVLIVLSTLFVKQHAIIDIVSSLICVILSSLIVCNFKLDNKLKRKIEKE